MFRTVFIDMVYEEKVEYDPVLGRSLPAFIPSLVLSSAGKDGLTHNMLENIHAH
jgi:hypothetical protein